MFEISDAKINKKKYSTKDTIDKALQTKLLQKPSFSCFLIENTDNSLSRIIKNRLYAFFIYQNSQKSYSDYQEGIIKTIF